MGLKPAARLHPNWYAFLDFDQRTEPNGSTKSIILPSAEALGHHEGHEEHEGNRGQNAWFHPSVW